MKIYKTPEHMRERALKYYYDNKEKVKEYQEKWRREKGIPPRQPAKTDEEKLAAVVMCEGCGKQITTPSRLKGCRTTCLRCERRAHPQISAKNSRQYRASKTSAFGLFKAWKATQVCGDCGVAGTKESPLDFHHRDPATKEFKISRGLHSVSAERLWAEIAKCDVLCKPCHMTRHPS